MTGTRLPLGIIVGLFLIASRADAQQGDWPVPKVEPQLPQVVTESSLVAAARSEAISRSRGQNRAADPFYSAGSRQSRSYTGSRFRRVPDPSYRSRFRSSYRRNRNAYGLDPVVPYAVYQFPTLSRSGIFYFGHFGRLHPSQYVYNSHGSQYFGR